MSDRVHIASYLKAESWEEALNALSADDYEFIIMQRSESTAVISPDHTISSLFARQNEANFADIFDTTLTDIARDNTSTSSLISTPPSLNT